jgi:hypothetical protein
VSAPQPEIALTLSLVNMFSAFSTSSILCVLSIDVSSFPRLTKPRFLATSSNCICYMLVCSYCFDNLFVLWCSIFVFLAVTISSQITVLGVVLSCRLDAQCHRNNKIKINSALRSSWGSSWDSMF